jgi:hypothetical protein
VTSSRYGQLMVRWKIAGIGIGIGIGIATFAPWLIHRVARWRTCAATVGAYDTEPFDATVWSLCMGPHRIAIARRIVDDHRLVGRPVADVVEMLGPTESDRDGHIGWHLGEPEGSPSLFPNELLLGIDVDRTEHVVDTRMVDEFEGP